MPFRPALSHRQPGDQGGAIRITVLGESGGYILGPSHAIQTGTPPENIVAMFDTAPGSYPF